MGDKKKASPDGEALFFPAEPAIGIEPMTARLRIECSTTELRWRATPARARQRSPSFHALARTRTVTPCGTTPSRWRVYQFHHQGKTTGSTGLEPATSRVTVECSNQAELRPPCFTATTPAPATAP